MAVTLNKDINLFVKNLGAPLISGGINVRVNLDAGLPMSSYRLNGVSIYDMLAMFDNTIFCQSSDKSSTYLKQMSRLEKNQKLVEIDSEITIDLLAGFFRMLVLEFLEAASLIKGLVQVKIGKTEAGGFNEHVKMFNIDLPFPSKLVDVEDFEGFNKRYASIIASLIDTSLAKFSHHKKKLDWRDNPKKLDLGNLMRELQGEVDELKTFTSDANFDEELGDVVNYLVILKDIKELK